MKLILQNGDKVQQFIAMFKGISRITSDININPNEEGLYLQGMDSAHCCLAEVKIDKSWFCEYTWVEDVAIGINTTMLSKVIDCWSSGYTIQMTTNDENSTMNIVFQGDKLITKEFNIPQMTIERDIVDIPVVDYDMDLTIVSTEFKNMIDELKMFNDTLIMSCNLDFIELTSSGDDGTACLKIKEEDIIEYAVALDEGDTFVQHVGINMVHICCSICKINDEVNVHCSKDSPLKISYSLDGLKTAVNPSYIRFFIAPKVEEI
jgi:proliferating cell nuclear antigen PCNA